MAKQLGGGLLKSLADQTPEGGPAESAAPAEAEEAQGGGPSPLAKRRVKQGPDAKRHTVAYALKEPFSDIFDDLVAKMPEHVRDRVIMRELPSKSMERNDYVGLYAHEYKQTRRKEAKYREPDNATGRDAKFS